MLEASKNYDLLDRMGRVEDAVCCKHTLSTSGPQPELTIQTRTSVVEHKSP